MVTKFSTGIDFDDISEEFSGQGHRSRPPGQKTDFQYYLTCVPGYETLAYGMTC